MPLACLASTDDDGRTGFFFFFFLTQSLHFFGVSVTFELWKLKFKCPGKLSGLLYQFFTHKEIDDCPIETLLSSWVVNGQLIDAIFSTGFEECTREYWENNPSKGWNSQNLGQRRHFVVSIDLCRASTAPTRRCIVWPAASDWRHLLESHDAELLNGCTRRCSAFSFRSAFVSTYKLWLSTINFFWNRQRSSWAGSKRNKPLPDSISIGEAVHDICSTRLWRQSCPRVRPCMVNVRDTCSRDRQKRRQKFRDTPFSVHVGSWRGFDTLSSARESLLSFKKKKKDSLMRFRHVHVHYRVWFGAWQPTRSDKIEKLAFDWAQEF